jgi:hypothetical protein
MNEGFLFPHNATEEIQGIANNIKKQDFMTIEGLLFPQNATEEIQIANRTLGFEFRSHAEDQTNYAVCVFHYLSVALGFLAILVQLFSLLRILFLRNVGKQENYNSILFRHQIVRAEAKSKRATSTKINQLIENARKLYNLGELINDPDKDVRRRGMKIFRTVLGENKTEIKHINFIWALKEVYSGASLLKIFTLTPIYLVPLITSYLDSNSCAKRESS